MTTSWWWGAGGQPARFQPFWADDDVAQAQQVDAVRVLNPPGLMTTALNPEAAAIAQAFPTLPG
ncbi:hypothetical protein [Kitasatospora albolonga]|uniref:hypothetical protein n=1 Tax=Kitasatospora albolonga TaxID=68173 RepID=UPI0031EFE7D5